MSFSVSDVASFHARYVLLAAAVLGMSGCATVGPQSISAGRGVYTEVINRTEDEQLLNVLVRMRYDETFGMISVTSITANLQFSARAEANVGFGDSDDYAGNLVPLAAGVGYEENPTISYVPLSGEDFTLRMLRPVSAREWTLLGQNVRHPGKLLSLAAKRINGLRNPLLGEQTRSPEFARFIELFDRLRRAGLIETVRVSGTGNMENYAWHIHDYQGAYGDDVRELLDLIGIKRKLDGAAILLPVREAVGSSNSAVHVQPRSAYDVLRVFGTGIEVPSAHLKAGIVEPLSAELPERGRVITIHSSEKRPDHATVRIRFRDWWFYIDETDTQSKRAFSFLQTFIGMRLADPTAGQKAPVITVPVK